MAIPIRPHDTLIVDLPRGRDLRERLRELSVLMCGRDACNVVMDFARVITFSSACLTGLLWLRRQLLDCGCRLVLCNVGPAAYKIFYVTGLTELFEIADNRSDALVALRDQAQAGRS